MLVLMLLLLLWSVNADYSSWSAQQEYCMDLTQIDNTSIPPIQSTNNQLRLVQVQVVARHGARAPFSKMKCWDYKNDPMTTQWNCSSSAAVWSQDIRETPSDSGYGRLFQKTYMSGRNILAGSCPIGGLLPLGRQQHRANGRILSKAYIGKGPLKLFDTDAMSKIKKEQIFLRSDDEERTLGSGQALMDGMFPVEVNTLNDLKHMHSWHTADMATDYIGTNPNICPVLNQISSEFEKSKEVYDLESNPEIQKIKSLASKHLGKIAWENAFECLMLSRCNDIHLPIGISEELFNKLINFLQYREFLHLTYRNSMFSKINMSPLMNDLINRMEQIINQQSAPHEQPPKFALTMGHDSTVMPLLAAMLGKSWKGKWTPYAGVLSFELYSLQNNSHNNANLRKNYAVRLIFKGQILTIPGCGNELCNYSTFFRLMEFGRTQRDCSKFVPNNSLSLHSKSSTRDVGYMILLGIIFVITAIIGKNAYKRVNVEERYLPLLNTMGQ